MSKKSDIKEVASAFGVKIGDVASAFTVGDLKVYGNLKSFVEMMIEESDEFNITQVMCNLLTTGTIGAMKHGSVEHAFLHQYDARKLTDGRVVRWPEVYRSEIT